MTARGPLRGLVVSGEVEAALGLDVVRADSLDAALARVGEESFDVVLLGPAAAMLDAMQAVQRAAPETPIIALPRHPTGHLRVAIETATRNPRTAAATARRVAALLPNYVKRRADELAPLSEALERGDFEPIARAGHNMRGNGVSFGFPELSEIGESLEASANARRGDEVRALLGRLRTCVS